MSGEAWGAVATVEVGGVSLRIPAPVGFLRYDGQATQIDLWQGGFIPESNRLVAAFSEREDWRLVRREQIPTLARVFSVQVHRQFESLPLSAESFVEVQRALRQQLGTWKNRPIPRLTALEHRVGGVLSQNASDRVQVKLEEIGSAEIFDETPSSVCFSLLVKYKMSGTSLDYPVEDQSAVAVCLLRVGERLLYLQAATLDGEPADAEWAHVQLLSWRDQVVAANQPGVTYTELPGSLAEEETMDSVATDPTNMASLSAWQTRSGKRILAAMAAAILVGLLSLVAARLRRRGGSF